MSTKYFLPDSDLFGKRFLAAGPAWGYALGGAPNPSEFNQGSRGRSLVKPVPVSIAMKAILTIEQLEELLSEPAEPVVESMRRLAEIGRASCRERVWRREERG